MIKLLSLILIINTTLLFSQYDTLSIYFEFNKSTIIYTQKIKITSFLNKNKKNIDDLRILGYADYKGSAEYNIDLSQNRANNIYSYLIKYGLSTDLISSCSGKGKLPSNISEEERYKQRRVDIIYKGENIRVNNNTRPKVVIASTNSIKIDNVKKGGKLVLENMFFIGGRHFIKERSMPVLKDLLRIMIKNPNLKIEIQGHICCQGDGRDGRDFDTGKNNLSVARAKYVYDYLIDKGIDENRLSYKGFGSRSPLKGFSINHPLNRRVEIMIIDK